MGFQKHRRPQLAPTTITEPRQLGSKTYSTSEMLTGDIWVDGKPIYRKVINFGALPNGTFEAAHGITGIYAVISLRGVAYNSSTGAALPVPNTDEAGTDDVELKMTSDDKVSITTTADLVAYNRTYVIIEYVKS